MKIFSSKHETIVLSEIPFASGGEGSIYKVESAPTHLQNVCVKIYHSHVVNKQREERIKYMVANPPSQIRGEGFMLGWPMDYVTDTDGKFLGFVMPLGFSDSKELVNLTATTLSKNLGQEWQERYDRSLGKKALLSRLKLICNIAIPVHILHATGKYVLKDFKPQNVLSTADGRITICDMDSIQIADGGNLLFSGTAATPDYMPPEFYSKGIGKKATDVINESWDTFAMGVVFYQLLFGIHPYVVTPKEEQDDGANSISSNISSGLFPFGVNGDMVKIRPKLHDKFTVLPQELQDLFVKTFSDEESKRPSAEDWGKNMNEIVIKALVDNNSDDIVDEISNNQNQIMEVKKKKRVKVLWILIPIFLLLGIVFFFTFGGEKEVPFPEKIENFVNQIYSGSTSFDSVEWECYSNKFDSLMYVYGSVYKELSPEELDRIDEAIDRYQLIARKSVSNKEVAMIQVDEIEYDDSESPSNEWKDKYASICRTKIDNMNLDDFNIPNEMMELHPCLVYLILKSKSISSISEKQSWFDLYSLMDEEKIDNLYGILYRESYKLGKIKEENSIKDRADQLNTEAYEYANNGDFYKAMITINKAIEIIPDEANYYDSKGEFCVMQGRFNRALLMWKKVMELSPDFLQNKKDKTTPLYDKLKEQGLLE